MFRGTPSKKSTQNNNDKIYIVHGDEEMEIIYTSAEYAQKIYVQGPDYFWYSADTIQGSDTCQGE